MDQSEITLTIPLTLTVSIGDLPESTRTVSVPAVERAARAIRPSGYYDGYAGYRADFLGADVPLPTLTPEQRAQAAVNVAAAPGDDPSVLPYTHFSVVMNRARQLAYYTAVNIDGGQSVDQPRHNDKWFYDSRIAESEQIGEELYQRNALDRGHLVRRLDPVWGGDSARANDDTFHFTNCSPQHERFNQGQDLWQGLENYLLTNADTQDRKITVFTGPIMSDADPLYKGVRLPLAFWKVIAYRRATGELATAAYVLEQGKLIEDMLARDMAFQPGTYRVPLAALKARTGLIFDYLGSSELPLTSEGLERGLERAPGTDHVRVRDDYSNVVL